MTVLSNIPIHTRTCPQSLVPVQWLQLESGKNSKTPVLNPVLVKKPTGRENWKPKGHLSGHFPGLECLSLCTQNIRQDGWCCWRSRLLSCRAIKVNRTGATRFTHSCVFPGVALWLRVLDLSVEEPVNKWFCHCVHTFLRPIGLLGLTPPPVEAATQALLYAHLSNLILFSKEQFDILRNMLIGILSDSKMRTLILFLIWMLNKELQQ